MKFAPFQYERPTTIAEATAMLAHHGADARVLAGGQSLMPMMAFRLATPTVVVDINRIPGLGNITVADDGAVHLGALVRWRDIEDSSAICAAHPLLSRAVSHIAHYQVRNRGTVGGSLANADPAAELIGIAVTCDALVDVAGPAGTRVVKTSDLIVGSMFTSLAHDEIITGLRFPVWPRSRRWAFEEFARHKGDFALAGVAVMYDEFADGRMRDVRIGAIGVNPAPRRLRDTERALEGHVLGSSVIAAAMTAARAEVDPPQDIHASMSYRRSLCATLLERCLNRTMEA